jgi:ribonuclease HI
MNQAGFAKYARRTDLAPLQDAIHAELGTGFQWRPHLRSPPPRKRRPTEAFSKTTKRLKQVHGCASNQTQALTPSHVIYDRAGSQCRFPASADIMSTDGSKKGSTVTGAAVLQTEEIEEAFKLSDHDGQLNTPLHGELAAIHTALTQLQLRPQRHRDVVMTDSQTALHLIKMAIHRPEDMRLTSAKRLCCRLRRLWRLGLAASTY